MTNHKFTDDDVIKALNCCAEAEYCATCLVTDSCKGMDSLMENSLALINRQKAEIESLNAVHADMTESLRLAAEANKDMQAKIEKLKGSRDRWKQIATDFDKASRETEKEIERLTILAELGNMRANDYRAMRDKAKNARAEAIKEFAERLKKKMYPYNGVDKKKYAINAYAVEKAIEGLVKEMTEESK